MEFLSLYSQQPRQVHVTTQSSLNDIYKIYQIFSHYKILAIMYSISLSSPTISHPPEKHWLDRLVHHVTEQLAAAENKANKILCWFRNVQV